MSKENLDKIILRLIYTLKDIREQGGGTIILGAGCSLSSSENDISTIGIMKQCLYEHQIFDFNENEWESLYKSFINNVWDGKAIEERRNLLKKRLQGSIPSEGHIFLRKLLENGFIKNVITTNFDMLIEDVCEGLSYRKRVGDGDYVVIGSNPKFDLLKVHGDIGSGELRFAPDELDKLPVNLSKDIYNKTYGLTIFLGYRGKDIGLMSSINYSDAFSIYWVDIKLPNESDIYESKPIYDLLYKRKSHSNILYGNEYGNFHSVMRMISNGLIPDNLTNVVKTKEVILSKEWRDTSILDLIRIYSRIYEIFLDILECSRKIYNLEINSKESDKYEILYITYLNAYLYFFKNNKLPASLINIPNNEIDALILGVIIEIIVRSACCEIDYREYVEKMKSYLVEKSCLSMLNGETFWNAVESILYGEAKTNNIVHINFNKNNINTESIEVPLRGLSEIIKVINFLSMTNIPSSNNKNKANYYATDILYRSRNSLSNNDGKIFLNLGVIEQKDVQFLNDPLVLNLPEISKKIKDDTHIEFDSKWVKIVFDVKDSKNSTIQNDLTLYQRCLYLNKRTTKLFLNLGSAVQNSKHTHLQFDFDLPKFINSEYPALFVVGVSGSGKTSALQNFVLENKDNNKLLFIIFSPKNMLSNKYGLSMFLDLDIDDLDNDNVLLIIDKAFILRKQKLILIMDGLNEINESDDINYSHYVELVSLGQKIKELDCKNIKLVITCREWAYYQYKLATKIQLNHLCFYSNDKSKIGLQENQDASYRIMPLRNKDIKQMLQDFTGKNKMYRIIGARRDEMAEDDITPLFIATACDYLNNANDITLDLKNFRSLYDIFIATMMTRIAKTNEYLAKKIIYSYFDLILQYPKSNIEITRYKILDSISSMFHKNINKVLFELIDANILIEVSSGNEIIKFKHDKIEEFFFQEYLNEFKYKGMDLLYSAFEVGRRNLIYLGGLTLYFTNLYKVRNLKDFKDNAVLLSSEFMDILPKVIIDALSSSDINKEDLEYLFNKNDNDGSKKFINILIWGLDQSLLAYSLVSYNLNILIETLLSFDNNEIVTNSIKAYLNFFKSKLHYFTNKYVDALYYADRALKLLGKTKPLVLSKVKMHMAVIMMEQGLNKESIKILSEEYEKSLKNGDNSEIIRVGIELGRSLNHSGQINKPLAIYNSLLKKVTDKTNPYIVARICEQKGNTLNKIMFNLLKFGFKPKEDFSDKKLRYIDELFHKSIKLYKKSMDLLLSINEVFCYSGVVPEIINTYISYSFLGKAYGIEECKILIEQVDKLFINITTPYKTDFYLSKAYYYEYLEDIKEAEFWIKEAIENAKNLNIKNKESKCYTSYGMMAYRQLTKIQNHTERIRWKSLGIKCIDYSIKYYSQYSVKENNINYSNCLWLRRLFDKSID